jgi:hypothetical protein
MATVFAAFFLSNLEFKFFWMALIMVAVCRNVVQSESVRDRRTAYVADASQAPTRPAAP